MNLIKISCSDISWSYYSILNNLLIFLEKLASKFNKVRIATSIIFIVKVYEHILEILRHFHNSIASIVMDLMTAEFLFVS